ncbi:probable enoyl-CoA hydratase [Belonocnema kinseyi]|uniref:probable enoyl-CoA hydratase n=1 Tax=Belonocnema kinseyi TaxID=2817044 RepID=UPI00143CEA69|nr:probable enoyl-CoA hydratase [Belonocnema kinseyi]
MILSRRITVLCEHLKQNIKRTLTFNTTSDVSSANNSSISKPDTEKSILVNIEDKIMTITINRPKKKNSLDVSTAQYLSEALDAFDENKEVSVGILHGANGNFCAGYDLHEIEKHHGKSEHDLPQFASLSNRDSLPEKPLIAAIEGFAVGVGLELALMCDMRIIDETAALGFLNRRFGIPIMCGGTVRLPKLIGYSRAMDMILTGRFVEGKQALEYGLANRLVACGTAVGQATLLAKHMTYHPQEALLADRLSAHYATFGAIQIDEALQFEKDSAANPLFKEGVQEARKFAEGLGRHGKSVNYHERLKIKDISDDLL